MTLSASHSVFSDNYQVADEGPEDHVAKFYRR